MYQPQKMGARMARATKTGKLLSFNTSRKCWCKNYQDEYGKRKTAYFGRGASSRDTKSYDAALEKYHPWKRELEARRQLVKIRIIHKAVLEGKLPVSALGNSPWAAGLVAGWRLLGQVTDEDYFDRGRLDTGEIVEGSESEWVEVELNKSLPEPDLEAIKAKLTTKASKPPRPRTNTIQDHVDAWLASEEAKHKANPKDLSTSALRDKRQGIKTFSETDFDCFGAGTKRFGSPAKVDQLCLDYKAWLLERMLDKESKINKPNTVNDKTKFAKQFLEWCWTRGILKDIPRTLKEMAKRLYVKRGGEPLELDTLRKLWDVAGSRMKCYMLLGLNCAFKPGDITAITGDMIQSNRLIGTRKKTEKHMVPMNYPLWPSTLKMLKLERDRKGDKELLFVNTQGNRITTSTFSSLFRKVADKAGVKAKFEQLRDTSAQLVANELMQNGYDLAYKQIFIAHKDSSTASYYLDDDPKHLKTPHLDKIVLGLEKTYGLKLPKPEPKK